MLDPSTPRVTSIRQSLNMATRYNAPVERLQTEPIAMRAALAMIAAVTVVTSTPAQSLADLARKVQEERGATPERADPGDSKSAGSAPATKVYTNASLRSEPAPADPAEPLNATDTSTVPAPENTAVDLGNAKVHIDRRTVERALALGRASDRERAQFHARYVYPVTSPVVDRVEIITEFRRVMLASEEQVRMGNRQFGLREALPLLQPWRGRVAIIAHVRFHPHNTFIEVPPYEVSVGDAIAPLETERIPIIVNVSQSTRFLLGAQVQAVFDGAQLMQEPGMLVVRLVNEELAAVRVDFGSLE